MDSSLRRQKQIEKSVQKAIDAQVASIKAIRNLLAIFCVLTFLGFPGNLKLLIGGAMSSLIEYISFGVQFMLIMFASSNDVMNIKLVNLQPAYWIPYVFVLYVTVDSLAMASDKKTVIITLVHLFLTVMFAIWLIEQYDMEELMTIFYIAQLIYVVICLVGMVAFSRVVFFNYQGAKTFRGLYGSKNECGTQLSLGILVQCILFRILLKKKKRVSIVFLGLFAAQFFLMLLTKAAGSIVITMAFIGYIILYGIQKKKFRLPLGLLLVVVSFGFLFFALTVLQMLAPFLESIGKDASLTGRVPIWERAIYVMQQSHTLTGYGLEMFWKTSEPVKLFKAGFDKYSWAATTATNTHNTTIEIWCNLGLIGGALYFIMFLAADKGVKYLEENQYLFCSSYLVMFIVRGLTERQTAPGTVYVMVAYVALAMMYQAKYRHRIGKYKKARGYKEDDGREQFKKEPTDGYGLEAFQKQFSNMADKRFTERRLPPRTSRIAKQEEEEDQVNKLEQLLMEFDDDQNE